MSRMLKSFGPVLAALFMVLCVGRDANAQDRGACAGDVAKFCKDVQPGGGRMVNCLRAHESELSSQCRESMATNQSRMREARDACAHDARRLCSEAGRGGGRIMECLRENEQQLSPACRDKLHSSRPR